MDIFYIFDIYVQIFAKNSFRLCFLIEYLIIFTERIALITSIVKTDKWSVSISLIESMYVCTDIKIRNFKSAKT